MGLWPALDSKKTQQLQNLVMMGLCRSEIGFWQVKGSSNRAK
jgi:type I site-specific restriction endonuclease